MTILTGTMARAAGLVMAPLMLAACSVDTGSDVVVPDAAAVCLADNYQQYVGQRSPAISLPAGTDFRHYRTGDPVTMDFSPSRLNFEYDRSGTLVKVSCG
ncbi:MAG: I78 family peptidase inhibitor [Paracoccus sp. (in: a-proteobacteria)]|nr:I78 family peptidase inhibitor [Paracoccus sp. (in: a-proteobacteria)]